MECERLSTLRRKPQETRLAAVQVAAAAPAGTQGAAAGRSVSEVRTDPFAREGAFFGANVVNLPNGKPLRRGEWDFFIGHRFSEDIDAAGLGGLFGFDSSAVIAYGVKVGLTDRLGVGLMRSNLDKTISLSSAFQISRQSAEFPLTFQVRAGVDGVQNFGLCDDEKNFSCRKQYSPFLGLTFVRTFADRISFLASPIVAFNTRNEDTFFPPEFIFGGTHDDTISFGVGTGIRLLPSVSLVGEIIPRLQRFPRREKRLSRRIDRSAEIDVPPYVRTGGVAAIGHDTGANQFSRKRYLQHRVQYLPQASIADRISWTVGASR